MKNAKRWMYLPKNIFYVSRQIWTITLMAGRLTSSLMMTVFGSKLFIMWNIKTLGHTGLYTHVISVLRIIF